MTILYIFTVFKEKGGYMDRDKKTQTADKELRSEEILTVKLVQ